MHRARWNQLFSQAERRAVLDAERRAGQLPEGLAKGAIDDEIMRQAVSHLRRRQVPSLDAALLTGKELRGTVVYIEQALYFKGTHDAVEAARAGRSLYASFKGTVRSAPGWRVVGRYTGWHFCSSSGQLEMSGRRRAFVVARVVRAARPEIELRPYVIGERYLAGATWNDFPLGINQYVSPELIREFQPFKVKRRGDWEPSLMRRVSERHVKTSFAQLVGESQVPNDWGGERSDLWAGSVHVGDRPLRAAFLLKGPAHFAPMKATHFGRNGDQIQRLFSEPADLCVVQHSHEVPTAIHATLEAFAHDMRNPRYYTIIDGQDTWRILKSHGLLPKSRKGA